MPEEIMALITIVGKGSITFSNEDLTPRLSGQNNALYLIMTCLQKHILLTLVDNDSTINVCHWKTTRRSRVNESQMSKPSTHLRAYNNPKRFVLGTILPFINVDPLERNVEFKVLDILATFNLLLGCLSLHEHRAGQSILQ